MKSVYHKLRGALGIASGVSLFICAIPLAALSQQQELVEMQVEEELTVTPEQRAKVNYDAYILGPGDGLQIELLDLPELSGNFSIGPDGTLYLPRLRALYVEGLTIEELRYFLTDQFSEYVRDPQVYVRPIAYRPIRIYVGGEVRRPGYYTLSGLQSIFGDVTNESLEVVDQGSSALGQGLTAQTTSISGGASSATLFPTTFDA
ncbi:MAG: polysaccharide biosynthesis/export family protein, partial [Prochlorococcus sp.]